MMKKTRGGAGRGGAGLGGVVYRVTVRRQMKLLDS